MEPYVQGDRYIRLTTPLGEDVLLVYGFRGYESLSSPFHFVLDLVSFTPDITFQDLLGQPVTLSLELVDGSDRYFHGHVRRFHQGSINAQGMATYRMEVVPWLWFLNLTADCRIFQQMSVQAIVTDVFDRLKLADYEFRGLKGGQEPWEYCVQYRESAFNFVSRLLEEEGIFYYFEHAENKHLLVLADDASQHQPCPGQEEARFELSAGGALDKEDVVLEATWSEEVQTGKFAHADFNFEMPSTPLAVELAAEGDLEVYDYPGRHLSMDRGDALAALRVEKFQSAVRRLHGRSNCRAFSPGFRFDLVDYPRSDLEATQVIHTVTHQGRQSLSSLLDSAGKGEGFHYENTFTSFPHSVPFRPPHRARKPIVQGSQTAIVVGKSGEEIWTDSYGRVKVQFHWDRLGAKDENSSCWVRVAHQWAGKNWGSIYLPRIGQEVVVDFLEGDPDRPIIIGRVYNAEQMPPYTLPDDQTKSTIKSDSSKGGGGFNEFRFEDKAGEEEIFLHGQKDWTIKILNDKNQEVDHDETQKIGNDRTREVGNDESVTIGHDRWKEVKNDEGIKIGNDRTTEIGNNETLTVGVDRSETIGSNDSLMVGVNKDVMVGANETIGVGAALAITVGAGMTLAVGAGASIAVGGAKSESVSGSSSEDVGKGKAVQIGEGLSETVGKDKVEDISKNLTQNIGEQQKVTVKKEYSLQAKKIQLVADDEVSIKTGKAEIVMKKSGDITINGKKITVKGSGDVVIKGSKIAGN